MPDEKIHVISNWVDPEAYYVADPDPLLAQELGLANRFNIMFAGNMGEAQGLETVLKAARLLEDISAIQFVFVGDGVALPRLQRIEQEYKLQNVRFLGRFPQERMPHLYALGNVLLIHLKDEPLFRITIPHKTLVYMASGKPILAAVAGDTATAVTEAGAGIACLPGNPKRLADAVRYLFKLDRTVLNSMGMKGRKAARTLYSQEHLVTKMERVLIKAIGEARCIKRNQRSA